jgi:hypothetical protein
MKNKAMKILKKRVVGFLKSMTTFFRKFVLGTCRFFNIEPTNEILLVTA